MLVFKILALVLSLASPTPDPSCSADGCPGSAFTAIAASFATQGYWAQAGIIHLITETGFQNLAAMVYILAIAGGIVGMAFGAPPKLYLWFFMGPAVFHWLLGTTQNVQGVSWMVAGEQQDQSEVWKLAETGLKSSSVFTSASTPYVITSNEPPKNGPWGDGRVPVSTLFLWVDELSSDIVQTLTRWFGVYTISTNTTSGGNQNATILDPAIAGSKDGKWYLLSNIKWQKIENITAARLSSGDLRDAFVTFLGGECGEDFNKQVDQGRFTAATKATGGWIPFGVFKGAGTNWTSYSTAAYPALERSLGKTVPMPDGFKRLATSGSGVLGDGSFPMSIGDYAGTGTTFKAHLEKSSIQCAAYLDTLINGFRWEAGHHYQRLIEALPKGVTPAHLVAELFNGWNIQSYTGDDYFRHDRSAGTPLKANMRLPAGEPYLKERFIMDLILIHMVRNEFLTAPKPVDVRFAPSIESQKYVEDNQRTVGSKTKFGEVYSWALMVPYLQGVLLYLLAFGFPFACIFVMIPGWHKIIFTWMSFWIWAKLWDVGFAAVTVLERSIWSILGNSAAASKLNAYVVQMQDFGKTFAGCQFTIWVPYGGAVTIPWCLPGVIPRVHVGAGAEYGTPGPALALEKSYAIFDRAMTLSATMDLDLQNSYYIYIMAALYFAVPAVTGQLVLGAKAGVASMATGAFTNWAQEVGKAAGSGFSADLTKRAELGMNSLDQAAQASAARQSGLGLRSFDAGNNQVRAGMNAQMFGTMGQNSGLIGQNIGLAQRTSDATAQAATALGQNVVVGQQSEAGNASAGSRAVQQATNPLTAPRSRSAPTSGAAPATGAPPVTGNGGGLKKPTPQQVGTGLYYGGIGVDAASQFQMNKLNKQMNDLSAANQIGQSERAVAANNAQADINARSAGWNIDQAYQSAAQNGYGLAAGRLMSHAQGDAQNAAWYKKAAFAQGAAGTLAAMGAQAPSPGPKPTDIAYMGMSGMLGLDAQAAGQFANRDAGGTGAFWGERESLFGANSGMRQNFGGGRIWSAYQQGAQTDMAASFATMNNRLEGQGGYRQGFMNQTKTPGALHLGGAPVPSSPPATNTGVAPVTPIGVVTSR